LKLQNGNRRFGVLQALMASAALVCLALVSSCGGDDGVPSPVAQFVPDQPPETLKVTLQVGSISGTVANLEVIVSGVADVFSANFDITYDQTIAFFLEGLVTFEDSFLDCTVENDRIFQVELDQNNPGRVVIGMTRLKTGFCEISLGICTSDADCPFPGERCGKSTCDAVGDAKLVTLPFQILLRDTTRIDFADTPAPANEPPALLDFDLMPLVQGTGDFLGGSLSGI